jgi:hypothetical protein
MLVERVVAMPAPVQGLLLDPAANFVHDVGAELDDMAGVQHGDGVGQTVAQRVGVAAERSSAACLTPPQNFGVWASSHALYAVPERPGRCPAAAIAAARRVRG